MSKQLYTFSGAIAQNKNAVKVDYNDEGVEKLVIKAMLFSTDRNRNKAYFQVFDLMMWKSQIESILHNLNHDLSLSNNAYLGREDNVLVDLWYEENNGHLEIWCTFETTDTLMIQNRSRITAPSIELLADESDIIRNDNGLYLSKFDWIGIGWLLGQPAGSGPARITEIQGYSHVHIDNDGQMQHFNSMADAKTTNKLTFDWNIAYCEVGDFIKVKESNTFGRVTGINEGEGGAKTYTVDMIAGGTNTYTITDTDDAEIVGASPLDVIWSICKMIQGSTTQVDNKIKDAIEGVTATFKDELKEDKIFDFVSKNIEDKIDSKIQTKFDSVQGQEEGQDGGGEEPGQSDDSVNAESIQEEVTNTPE